MPTDRVCGPHAVPRDGRRSRVASRRHADRVRERARRGLQHLRRAARQERCRPAHSHRLGRGSGLVAGRVPARLRERARRGRSVGHLGDERRRDGRPPAHDRSGRRRGTGLGSRRQRRRLHVHTRRNRELYFVPIDGGSQLNLTHNPAPDGAFDSAASWHAAPALDGCTVRGTEAGDRLVGTAGDDVICGLAATTCSRDAAAPTCSSAATGTTG